MNNFIIYDIVFLIAFTLFVIVFLYRHKKNLKRQGWLYLYPTKVGITWINSFAKKYEKILRPLQYIVVASGFLLMAAMLWFLGKFSWTYLTSPTIAQELKIPVLMPLLPYLPEIFKVDFLPPFYFTYWIIIIALIAIPHEFAHGIFARVNKINIKATGFGFLGPFLAAFVDPDEKQTNKASKFAQMSVLAAGTFANVLVTILFVLLLWGFTAATYVPSGIYFTYQTMPANVSMIDSANGYAYGMIQANPQLIENSSVVEIRVGDKVFLTTTAALKRTIEQNLTQVILSPDAPAFRAQMAGAITEFDGKKIRSFEDLRTALYSHKPGDVVEIKTWYQENTRSKAVLKNYTITLADNGEGKPLLGIGMIPTANVKGLMGLVYKAATMIKQPAVYYESRLGDFGVFVYDLLWWIALISISVALANMLPLGIFDGGRFFYLAVWGVSRRESWGKRAFKISTAILLALVILLMLKWIWTLPFIQNVLPI